MIYRLNRVYGSTLSAFKIKAELRNGRCRGQGSWHMGAAPQHLFFLSYKSTFLAGHRATQNKDNTLQSLLQVGIAIRLSSGQHYLAASRHLPPKKGMALFIPFFNLLCGEVPPLLTQNESSTPGMENGELEKIGSLDIQGFLSILIT